MNDINIEMKTLNFLYSLWAFIDEFGLSGYYATLLHYYFYMFQLSVYCLFAVFNMKINFLNILTSLLLLLLYMYVEYYLYHSCSEKLDTLFASLTKDLMDPDNSMERNFELMLELKTATEKYFHLKKLFWKVCLDAET